MADDKGKKAKKGRLRPRRTVDVPVREVSGLCLVRGRGGELFLLAVGDHAAVAAWARLPRDDRSTLRWKRFDVARLPGSRLPEDDTQIEAVCADGAGRVLLLQEAPPRAELIDLAARRVVCSIDLEVEGRGKLVRSWSDPDGSRGEGAVFLPRGHLLIAKEKRPRAFVEFGPRGARSLGFSRGGGLTGGERWPVEAGDHRFVALAVWWPDKALRRCSADFSDLEVGPDGRLYLLSDKSASIARLADLPPGGGTATCTAAWRVKGLDGKPEGLAFTASGRAVVALDTRKARRNLVLLEPAIAMRLRARRLAARAR